MLPRYSSVSESERKEGLNSINQKRLTARTLFSDDSDDEKISVPPKLSNFGSALLSGKKKENIDVYEILKSSPKDGVKLRSPSSNDSYHHSSNHTSGNTYASVHSGEPSQSTLFAHYKGNQQPSMTSMNSIDVQNNTSNSDFENSFQKIKSMQQSMKEELTSKHMERRSRRFLNSTRKEFLGPAKRASGIFPETLDRKSSSANNNNNSIGNNNSGNGSLPRTREVRTREGPSLQAKSTLTHIDLGDLNPVQYLKKYDLPTSELPRISRLYFERQKPRKIELGRLKQDILRENRNNSNSNNGVRINADAHHFPMRWENSVSSATQPRRKLSDTSSRSVLQRGFSSPVAQSMESQRNILTDRPSFRHNEYESYSHSNTLLHSHRKREALANIDVNRNSFNDQPYEPEPKRYKYVDEHQNDYKNNGIDQPFSFGRLPWQVHPPIAESGIPSSIMEDKEFSHREAPKPPVVKKVEIIEPKRKADNNTAKNSSSNNPVRRNTTLVHDIEYEKIELLGRGGSSKVYKVKDNNNKLYALKRVVFDEFDDSSINGFKGEIELLNKLKDQVRVVKLFDYEMEHGVLYLVMECGDHDLSQILNQRSGLPLDIEFVRYHAREMLKCVKVVHDAGIVHSDLKPANFVFVKGILKIIDFGIANAVPDHTVNIYRETQIGTPNYMAPEALVAMNYAGENTGDKYKHQNRWKVGKPSDVWSCGCIIYQMIYGRPPYGGFQGQNRLLAIMNPEVKVIFSEKTANDESVPFSALDTMKACLLRNPDKRWTIDEILNSPFLKPVMVTHFFIRDLIKNAVRYGADQREVSKEKVDELADDVLSRLADIRL